MAERSQRDDARQDGGGEGGSQPRQGRAKEWEREVEAAETDGRGTGGVGEDAGGYEPLPEPE